MAVGSAAVVMEEVEAMVAGAMALAVRAEARAAEEAVWASPLAPWAGSVVGAGLAAAAMAMAAKEAMAGEVMA